jgi:antitoxin (DNA-binding transcriptional repressor) of toxin-antitoxin stability system
MGHMERASVRELHLNTSGLIKNVKEGLTYVIESRGTPVAELRPIPNVRRRTKPLPDREAFIRTLPQTDIGKMLEEDREDRF